MSKTPVLPDLDALARAAQASIVPPPWDARPFEDPEARRVRERILDTPEVAALLRAVAGAMDRLYPGAAVDPALAPIAVDDHVYRLLSRPNPEFPDRIFENQAVVDACVLREMRARLVGPEHLPPRPDAPDPAATARFEADVIGRFAAGTVQDHLVDTIDVRTPNHYELETYEEGYDEDALVARVLAELAAEGLAVSEAGVRLFVAREYRDHVRELSEDAESDLVGGERFLETFYGKQDW